MSATFRSVGRPTSPTFSEASTRASQLGVDGNIITRADLRNSLQTYEQVYRSTLRQTDTDLNLLLASADYRAALLNLSQATAKFADAIQGCAQVKGCDYDTASRNAAAAGFHHLFANHLHILSDSVDRRFESPLAVNLKDYQLQVAERSESYERALREKSRIIRQTEEQNIRQSRRKERNMTSFREALSILQSQVDEIDRLKVAHYQEVEEHEERFAEMVSGNIAIVVRSTFEILDRLSAKSTDPAFEPMVHAIPDPFDSYGPPKQEGEIFSVLQPLAIMAECALPWTPTNSESGNASSAWEDTMGGLNASPERDDADDLPGSPVREPTPVVGPSALLSRRRNSTLTKPLPTVQEMHFTTSGERQLEEAKSGQDATSRLQAVASATSTNGNQPRSPSGTIRGSPPAIVDDASGSSDDG